MEIRSIAELREVLEVMRNAGCGRLVAGGVTLELCPGQTTAVAVQRERIEGTGTAADGLPVDHPGLRGIRLPDKAGG